MKATKAYEAVTRAREAIGWDDTGYYTHRTKEILHAAYPHRAAEERVVRAAVGWWKAERDDDAALAEFDRAVAALLKARKGGG